MNREFFMRNLDSVIRFLFTLIVCISIAGCDRGEECGEYWKFIDDSEANSSLLTWADKEIFDRSFSREDFQAYDSFVGPGKGGRNFDLAISNIQVPSFLEGYTIRSVGPNRDRPDVIYVGKRRYQGILITKDDFQSSIDKLLGTPLRIKNATGRVGLICYVDI